MLDGALSRSGVARWTASRLAGDDRTNPESSSEDAAFRATSELNAAPRDPRVPPSWPRREKRFIEVMGRAQSGPIVMTGPEVDKLRQLGERAWLYVVTFCKGERPRLRIIQDPISKLNPEMLYRQIQYLVEERDGAQQGEKVEPPAKTEEQGT